MATRLVISETNHNLCNLFYITFLVTKSCSPIKCYHKAIVANWMGDVQALQPKVLVY